MHFFIIRNYEKLSQKAAMVLRDELIYNIENIEEKERFIPGLATASTPCIGVLMRNFVVHSLFS